MDIKKWSSSAGGNTTAPPDGWPEGQPPSTVNDCAREMMGALRRQHESAEWIDFGHTPTFATTNSFTLAGDRSGIYSEKRRVWAKDATDIYATIISVTYSANTRVSLRTDSGVLSASLTGVALGILSSSVSLPESTTNYALSAGFAPSAVGLHPIDNIKLLATVATNALTFTVQTAAGIAPTASDKIYTTFRSATLTDGSLSRLDIGGASATCSIVINSGSHLAFSANEVGNIHFYFINDAGSIKPAFSRSRMFPEDKLVTTVAKDGGSGAIQSDVLYAESAISSVACRYLGKVCVQTGATAGNWSNAPSKIQAAGHGIYDQGLIWEHIVHTSATSTVSCPVALNSIEDGTYKLEIIFIPGTNTTANLSMFANGDTTSTNYYRVDGAGAAANDAFLFYEGAGKINFRMSIYGDIYITSGLWLGFSGLVSTRHADKYNVSQYIKSWSWMTLNNLTGLSFVEATDGGIGVGTIFRLYIK